LLLVCGCQPDTNDLVYRHMTEDQKVAAKQRWDSIRGKVKLQLVEQHLAAGRLEDAEKVLEQAMTLSPPTAEVYMLAARLRLEQGQLAKAREAITLAAAMSTGDPEIDYLAGMIAERYGDLHAALEHYSMAAQRAPNAPAYLLAQAETLIALDQLAEAIALLEPRLEDFEGEPAVTMLAAQVYKMLGLRAPAAEQCRKLLRGSDDDPELCAQAGLILSWARQHAEVIAVLRPLVDKHLADPAVFNRNALLLAGAAPVGSRASAGGMAVALDGHAFPDGMAAQGRGHATGPPDVVAPAVIHALARAYLETGQYREARWAAKIVMSADEHDATAWTLHARAAAMSGDLAAAASSLAAFHQNNSPTPETLLLVAYVALQRKDYAETVRAARQALELDADLPAAHYLISLASSALGRTDDARRGGMPASEQAWPVPKAPDEGFETAVSLDGEPAGEVP
jgi:tetratricopeptide (TPR) repeat protein